MALEHELGEAVRRAHAQVHKALSAGDPKHLRAAEKNLRDSVVALRKVQGELSAADMTRMSRSPQFRDWLGRVLREVKAGGASAEAQQLLLDALNRVAAV
jgi:hypothetical protein